MWFGYFFVWLKKRLGVPGANRLANQPACALVFLAFLFVIAVLIRIVWELWRLLQ